MEEKLMIGNVLTLTKNLCDILMHATIESPNNHNILRDTLDEYLRLQSDIYNAMVQKGWYINVSVDSSKIIQAKSKFNVN